MFTTTSYTPPETTHELDELELKLKKLEQNIADWQSMLDLCIQTNNLIGNDPTIEGYIKSNKAHIDRALGEKLELEKHLGKTPQVISLVLPENKTPLVEPENKTPLEKPEDKSITRQEEIIILKQLEKEIPHFSEMVDLCKDYNRNKVWVNKVKELLIYQNRINRNIFLVDTPTINKVENLKAEIQAHAAMICRAKFELKTTNFTHKSALGKTSLTTAKLLEYEATVRKIKRVELRMDPATDYEFDKLALYIQMSNDKKLKKFHEDKNQEMFSLDFTRLNQKYPAAWQSNIGQFFVHHHQDSFRSYGEQPMKSARKKP